MNLKNKKIGTGTFSAFLDGRVVDKTFWLSLVFILIFNQLSLVAAHKAKARPDLNFPKEENSLFREQGFNGQDEPFFISERSEETRFLS